MFTLNFEGSTTTTTTQAPLPTQGPSILSCTFEPNTDCFLVDDVLSDDFDWTQKSVRAMYEVS